MFENRTLLFGLLGSIVTILESLPALLHKGVRFDHDVCVCVFKRRAMHGKKWKFIHLFVQNLPHPPPLKKRGYLSVVRTGSCSENARTMFRPVSSAVPNWTHTHQWKGIIPGKIVPPGMNLFSLIMADSSCASLPPSGHVMSFLLESSPEHLDRVQPGCPVQLTVRPALIQGGFTLHLT